MFSVFVKIDGVKGTGTGAHLGWLRAENFAVRRSRKSQLVRFQDTASASLFRFHANSAPIPRMIVDAVRGGTIVWRAEMSQVVINSLEVSTIPQPWELIGLSSASMSIKTLSGAGLKLAAGPGGLAAREWKF
jgi:hypothetical protein